MPIIKNHKPEWLKYWEWYDSTQGVFQIIVWSNIFHWRKYRGLSQQELAKRAKITQSIVSELEDGDYNPSLELLSKVASALNIDPELLTKKRITRKMIEALDYIIQKIKDVDILKAMKLIFLIDYESKKETGEKMTGIDYFRWNRWPFNKDIYQLDDVFVKKWNFYKADWFKKYLLLKKEDEMFIDHIIKKYGHLPASKLMELTYKTEPMKGCTIWWTEKMGKVIL